jgi:hypothetical protein
MSVRNVHRTKFYGYDYDIMQNNNCKCFILLNYLVIIGKYNNRQLI